MPISTTVRPDVDPGRARRVLGRLDRRGQRVLRLLGLLQQARPGQQRGQRARPRRSRSGNRPASTSGRGSRWRWRRPTRRWPRCSTRRGRRRGCSARTGAGRRRPACSWSRPRPRGTGRSRPPPRRAAAGWSTRPLAAVAAATPRPATRSTVAAAESRGEHAGQHAADPGHDRHRAEDDRELAVGELELGLQHRHPRDHRGEAQPLDGERRRRADAGATVRGRDARVHAGRAPVLSATRSSSEVSVAHV